MTKTEEGMVVGKYPAQLLLDILSDGMDYAARGYWAQIKEYKWYWWYNCDENGHPTYPDTINQELVNADTILIEMRDDEDGEADKENREFVGITLNKLAEATDWALENYNHLYSWCTNNKGIRDEIDYDAIGSDVIIQKIVLGEAVYG